MKKLAVLLLGIYSMQYSLAETNLINVENPHFTNVVVQNSVDVKIKCGDDFAIETVGDEKEFTIKTKGDVLTIEQKKSGFAFFDFNYSFFDFDSLADVIVTVPPKGQILSISASGSSNVVFYQCATNDKLVALNVVGSSTLTGDVNSRAARVYVAGSSDMNITGAVKGLNLHVAGSSNFNQDVTFPDKFTVRDVRLKMSGSSNVRLCHAHDMIGEIAGSSNLVYGYTYDEKPRILRIKTTGSSTQTPEHCGK